MMHELFPEECKTWLKTKRGVSYCRMTSETTLICFSHPEARVEESLLYYGLVDAIREIKEMAKIGDFRV